MNGLAKRTASIPRGILTVFSLPLTLPNGLTDPSPGSMMHQMLPHTGSIRGGGCGSGERGCGWRTTAGGAAGPGPPGGGPGVRGCVACRSRLGPGRFGRQARRGRMRRMPEPTRAQQVPGGTSTPGINLHIKDHGRMGRGPLRWRRRSWLAGASARRDMTCRDRQWARTRMRPYTA